VTTDEELIAALWREVRPAQLDLLHELVADAELVRDTGDTEAWARLRSRTHRLAGTLGSFGQQPAGSTAVALDRIVVGVEEPDEDLVARAVALVATLHDELVHEPGEGAATTD
jgi:hypothetical protein